MAFVVESTSTNTADNSTTVAITKPSGVTSGELMVAILSVQAIGVSTIATLSGWTSAVNQTSTRTGGVSIQYKVAGDSEPANYTFTASAAGEFSGAIVRLSGNAPSDFLVGTDGYTANSVNSATISDTASITPVYDGSFVIMNFVGRGASSDFTTRTIDGYNTTPAITFTELYDVSEPGSNPRQAGAAYGIQTTAAEITQYGAEFSVSRADHLASIAVFHPPTSFTGSNNVTSTTTTTFSPSDVLVDVNGVTNTLTETTSETFAQSGRGEAPQQWSNEAKPSTTWNNEPK